MVYSTASCLATLATLGGDRVDLPWSSKRFCEITELPCLPWVDPLTLDPPVPRWKEIEHWEASDFVEFKKFHDYLPEKEVDSRAAFVDRSPGKKEDGFKAGRQVYKEYVKGITRKFKLKKMVDTALAKTGVNVFKRAFRLPPNQVIPLDMINAFEARVYFLKEFLGVEVFEMLGDAVDESYDVTMTDELNTFSRLVFNNHLHILMERRAHLHKVYEERDKVVEALSECLDEKSEKPLTMEALATAVIGVNEVISAAVLFERGDALDDLRSKLGPIRTLLLQASAEEVLEIKRARPRLAKVVMEALESFAAQPQVDALSDAIDSALGIKKDKNDIGSEHDEALDDKLYEALSDWESGVEHYKDRSLESLLAELNPLEILKGRGKKQKVAVAAVKTFHGFREQLDTSVQALVPTDAEWQTLPQMYKKPLLPQPHQITGVHAMVTNVLKRKPMLLMDGVGLGKTLQCIGLLSTLALLIDIEMKTKSLPEPWRSLEGIQGLHSDRPFLVVVPNNLIDQWTVEFRRYLNEAILDVYPLTGSTGGRAKSQSDWFATSNTPAHRRVVIATHSAVANDAQHLLVAPETSGMDEPKYAPAPPRSLRALQRSYSVFLPSGYNVAIFDEVHAGRKPGFLSLALKMLRKDSEACVGVTATPMMTSPVDLMMVGKAIGIPTMLGRKGTLADTQLVNNVLRRSAMKDRAARKGMTVDSLRAQATGTFDQGASDSAGFGHTQATIGRFMLEVRPALQGCIIRRQRQMTGLDATLPKLQEALIGLRPTPLDEKLIQKICDHEQVEYSDDEDEDDTGEKKQRTMSAFAMFASKKFYLAVRSGLYHPYFVYRSQFTSPVHFGVLNKKEWEAHPTAKMLAVIKLCRYHLSNNQAPPLTANADGKLVVDSEIEWPAPAPETLNVPDKIVLYSAFVKYNVFIKSVLQAYGIKVQELNGKTPLQSRRSILMAFQSKEATEDDARVLLLSRVGSVGLNIDRANVLIMFAPSWSGLETDQIVGRIYRQPQNKPVVVYHLVVLNSPEIFLSRIAGAKAFMHQAFVACDQKIRDAVASLKTEAEINEFEAEKTQVAIDAAQEVEQVPLRKRKTKATPEAQLAKVKLTAAWGDDNAPALTTSTSAPSASASTSAATTVSATEPDLGAYDPFAMTSAPSADSASVDAGNAKFASLLTAARLEKMRIDDPELSASGSEPATHPSEPAHTTEPQAGMESEQAEGNAGEDAEVRPSGAASPGLDEVPRAHKAGPATNEEEEEEEEEEEGDEEDENEEEERDDGEYKGEGDEDEYEEEEDAGPDEVQQTHNAGAAIDEEEQDDEDGDGDDEDGDGDGDDELEQPETAAMAMAKIAPQEDPEALVEGSDEGKEPVVPVPSSALPHETEQEPEEVAMDDREDGVSASVPLVHLPGEDKDLPVASEGTDVGTQVANANHPRDCDSPSAEEPAMIVDEEAASSPLPVLTQDEDDDDDAGPSGPSAGSAPDTSSALGYAEFMNVDQPSLVMRDEPSVGANPEPLESSEDDTPLVLVNKGKKRALSQSPNSKHAEERAPRKVKKTDTQPLRRNAGRKAKETPESNEQGH